MLLEVGHVENSEATRVGRNSEAYCVGCFSDYR